MVLVPGRRRLLRGAMALAAAAAWPSARACEFWSTSLRIVHPWSRATPADATAALVCMRFDEVQQDDRLTGVDTPLAESAETTGPGTGPGVDLKIPAGRETLLEETGTVLRLLGLRQPLLVGRSYPLTLHFERGGSVQTNLSIDFGGLRFSRAGETARAARARA